MAYGRRGYGRTPYARLLPFGATAYSLTAYAVAAIEFLTRAVVDRTTPAEVIATAPVDGPLLAEIRNTQLQRGTPGAFGRAGFSRGPFSGPALGPANQTYFVAFDAAAAVETLAAQTRWANAQGPYPIVNRASGLASGLVGAYFPGYGAPVVDATGSWNALTTQTWGSAGTLVGGWPLPAMLFDGLHNALWATGAGLPAASAAQVTLATAFQVSSPTHGNNTAFAVCDSTSSAGRLLLGWLTENQPAGSGVVYFNAQPPAGGTATLTSGAMTMPTGWLVVVGTVDTVGLVAQCFVNGTAIGSTAWPAGTPLTGFDTVGFSARINTSNSVSPATVTLGSPNVSSGGIGEDIGTGAPILSDSAGFIPAGTYWLSQDYVAHTGVLSQNATGTTTTDLITTGPPFTRMKNGAIAFGLIWNRLLSPAEIAAFSANPLAPFLLPEGDPLIEIGGAAIADTIPAAEAGLTQRRDTNKPAESLGTQQRDAALPAEDSGALALTGDQRVWFEIPARQQRDALAPSETLSTQTSDSLPPLEDTAAQRVGTSAVTETLARSLRDTGIPFEALGTAVVANDAVIPIELQLHVPADAAAPLAWRATLAIEGYAPLEILGGAGNVVADAGTMLEWLMRQPAGRPLTAESTIGVRADLPFTVESLMLAFADIRLQIENLSLGAVAAAADSGIPIEVTAQLSNEVGAPDEWILSASVTAEAQLPIEIGAESPAPAPSLVQVSGIRVRLLRG